MQTADMLHRIRPLFGAGGRFHNRYRLESETPPTELHPGSLWEVEVYPAGSLSCELMRVYAFDTTVGELLQAHWRNETRALLRLSTRGHRALPRLREAELLSSLDLGYLVVTDSGHALASDTELLRLLSEDRRSAFLTFFSIVEAIAAMHEEGLLHRNLTPQALRVAGEHNAIVIDGFQMSSFVAAWFRSAASAPIPVLAADATNRWMLAPERLAGRDGQTVRSVETYATDVFSLGMIGIWLFTGQLTTPPGTYSPAKHAEWVLAQQAALRAGKLPALLERTLIAMTSVERRERVPSAVVAHELLASSYGAILHDLEWRATEPERVYELLYLRESIERLYGDGRGRTPPSAPDYVEYSELIEQDLVSAVVTWSPDGFEPWERFGDRVVARQARMVILGRTYAYFCAFLDHGRATEDRSRIVVKHMLPIGRARSLRRSQRQRAAPRIACGYFSPSSGRRPARIPGTSPWTDITPTVEYEGGRSFADPVVATARWLLDAQRADIRRHCYYVTKLDELGDTITLRDLGVPESDSTDVGSAFDRLWAQTIPGDPMGSTVTRLVDLASDTDERQVFLLKEARDVQQSIAALELVQELDPDTCRFRLTNLYAPLTERAWLVPDDRGAHTTLRRQHDAVLEVEQRYGHLAAQIRAPRAVRIPSEIRGPSATLMDTVEQLIRRISESWPIFTVQGPPGTGKTWIAAELIQRALNEDPFARLLISAQSHHALDNLLEGVVRRLPDVSALRIASERTQDKLSEHALGHTIRRRLEALMESLSSLEAPRSEALKRLAKEWRRRVRDKSVELEADLIRRLPRASSVVFTTCAQATHESLGSARGAGSFDWVMLEEAARGWMTDFFVPMVHGARWLLVGDQAQLPAHRQDEFERVLLKDIADQVTATATGVSPTEEWKQFLRYFAHLMRSTSGRDDEPNTRLRVQRRMHPDIAALISSTFYADGLENHREANRPHGITAAPFAGTSLVWLDTTRLGVDAYERSDGGVRNRCEMLALRYYFRGRVGTPARHQKDIAPLAVLSPYRAQVRLLEEQLGYPDVVHTVDSFQGREAEIVLVSLARNNASEEPNKALGFLVDPSRVNVMLSRARRLLVIVGSLGHFERHGRGSFWEALCAYVRRDRRFVLDIAADGFTYSRDRRP